MYPNRALVIGDDITWIGGAVPVETPEGSLDNRVRFVERLALSAKRHRLSEMTVMLEATAAKILGLPARAPRTEKTKEGHASVAEWRDAGWNTSGLAPWFTLWAPNKPSIHVGIVPWLGTGNSPFDFDPYDAQRLADVLAGFQGLTGVAYHGKSGGIAGISLFRDHWKRARNASIPMWRPTWDLCTPARGDTEKSLASYKRDGEKGPYSLGFDAVRQYLPAAANVLATTTRLTRGRRPWSKKTVGYWRIHAPAWNVPGLPNPANYATGVECWVSGPTMELIAELADQGYTEMPDVLESWTADTGVGEILRPWAYAIEKAYTDARDGDFHDREILILTIKDMYKKGIGMLHRPNSRVWRPDWHHSVIAKARANLFRKMFGVWLLTKRVPEEIHYDEIWYSADRPDDVPMLWKGSKRVPAFPTESDRWGQFTVKVRENR